MIGLKLDERSLRKVKRNIEKKRKRLLSTRLKKRALKKGADIVKSRARSLVTVGSGSLRDSLKVIEQGNAVFIVSDDPGALSSEYLDTPYLRPASKSERRKVVKKIAEEYKRNV